MSVGNTYYLRAEALDRNTTDGDGVDDVENRSVNYLIHSPGDLHVDINHPSASDTTDCTDPDNPCKGEKITVESVPEGVKAYYASVDQKDDGLYLSGSRAMAFVGIGETLNEAEQLAQKAVSSVKGPVFHRKDMFCSAQLTKGFLGQALSVKRFLSTGLIFRTHLTAKKQKITVKVAPLSARLSKARY